MTSWSKEAACFLFFAAKQSLMTNFFDFKIIELEDYSLKVSGILGLIGFLLLVFIVLKVVKRSIFRLKRFDTGKKYTFYKLLRYTIYLAALIVSLQILGFKLYVIFASSAALLVGVGFGLQNLFSDFISGIIILLDGTIVVDDVIEVNEMICVVKKISLRTTTVIGRNDNYIILPNSDLTRNQIINWTHEKSFSRSNVKVGVDYGSDIYVVMDILKAAALAHPKVLREPEPVVRFADYGESSLDFELFFSTYEIFRVEPIKSDIRISIYEGFKAKGIEVPFPQRVVHLRKESGE